MKNNIITNLVAGCGLLVMLTSCNGIFDDIYDNPLSPAEGDLYVDASSWTKWHYIDLHAFQDAVNRGEKADLSFTTIDVSLTDIGEFDADGTGIYTYWYDVLGEGAEYGVIADRFVRKDHTETNFAVYHATGTLGEVSITAAEEVSAASFFVF